MPTDEPQTPRRKPNRTGFAVALTLNLFVLLSILIMIPAIKHDPDLNPMVLMAFFYQMGAVGVIAVCFAVGDLVINLQRKDKPSAILAAIGIVLGSVPQPLGSFLFRLVGHIAGWHLDPAG